MLLGRFRGTGGLAETQRRPGQRPACAAWCNQNGAHRLPTSFIPSLQTNTEPRGKLCKQRSAPVAFRGATAARHAGSPSSRHLPPTVGQARQLLPTATRIPRSWQRQAAGRSRVQGRRRIPGYKRRRQRARPAAAVGRLKTSEHRLELGLLPLGLELEAGGWDQGWGGTDARGARPGSRGRPRVAITSMQPPSCLLAPPPVERFLDTWV
ncbi:uncharacterized protein LOC110297796 [Mus caroli]|uniref:Uncharacterized protein LOC110297796 n=1 Tax=Mus caroli TaxID=10089 RepID=A0A6P5PZW7_MUSCR|nr:uncharacterized protein LOC110297796 [Mus caroli]